MRKTSLAILLFTFIMLVAVLLNIPILREITAFLYLSFVPGFLILRIIRTNKTNLADTFLFSIGLSLAFLIFVGLLINELYSVGISRPLSTFPLTLGIGLSTLVLLFINSRQNLPEDFSLWNIIRREERTLILKGAILVLLPVVGVLGALFVSLPLLLFLVIAIAVLFAASILSNRIISPKLFPLLVFTISLAILFQVVFTSKYIMGFDANLEFYVFRLTQINGQWHLLNPVINSIPAANYASMLSITVLPTIYSAVLNFSGEMVFKVLYPFVFALVPVVMYRLYQGQVSKLISLSSVFFFISGVLVFYGITPISLDRQILAELFFGLSVFVLLNEELSVRNRKLLMIIFGSALVVSHYSLTFIYLAFVLFLFVSLRIRGKSNPVLNTGMIALFFTTTFLWYGLAGSQISGLVQFFNFFISKFQNDLLNPSSRITTLSFVSQPISNITTSISVGVFAIANSFVILGMLWSLFRPQKAGLDSKYRTLSISSLALLVLCVALPNFAASLNFERFYGITFLILALFFGLGISMFLNLFFFIYRKTTSQSLSEKRRDLLLRILLCTVLICFFLTQTGFINRSLGGTPLVRPLDLDRLKTSTDLQAQLGFYGAYLSDQDVYGAGWLCSHKNDSLLVFGDFWTTANILVSYGNVSMDSLTRLTNETLVRLDSSYVYLSRMNVINKLIPTATVPFNISEVLPLFGKTDLVYSNGNCEILYAPPNT